MPKPSSTANDATPQQPRASSKTRPKKAKSSSNTRTANQVKPAPILRQPGDSEKPETPKKHITIKSDPLDPVGVFDERKPKKTRSEVMAAREKDQIPPPGPRTGVAGVKDKVVNETGKVVERVRR